MKFPLVLALLLILIFLLIRDLLLVALTLVLLLLVKKVLPVIVLLLLLFFRPGLLSPYTCRISVRYNILRYRMSHEEVVQISVMSFPKFIFIHFHETFP